MSFILKNDLFSISLSTDGNITAITNQNGVNVAKKTPFAVIYNDDKSVSLPTDLSVDGDIVTVTFNSGITIKVKTTVYNEFITFTLEYASSQKFHSVSFFNAEANIDYDSEEDDLNAFSACLIGLTLATHMKEHPGKNEKLIVTAYTHIGLLGNKRSPYNPACAVTVCKNCELNRIQKQILEIVPKGELPMSKLGGPYAKNALKSAKKTYTLHWTPITKSNFSESIDYFRQAGIEQINIHNLGQYFSGSFEVIKSAYPGGLEELKETVKMLHAEGFEVGFHPYVFFINPQDVYISPIPHDDIDVMRTFTLGKDLTENSTEIFTVEDLKGVSPFVSYVLCNSQTLRIDNELVKFKAVDESGRFYEVERGVLGTTPESHKQGATISQYKEYFFHYLAKPGSPLFYEIARNAAKFYNEVNFDSIYFDALDGASVLDGEDYAWYHATDFVREFFNNIDHPPVFDCCHNMQYTGTWFVRSRFGALDCTGIAYDEYKDAHVHYNKKVARRMGVNEELGWVDVYPGSSRSDYFLQLMPNRKENMAYLYGKMMATDACTTYLEMSKEKREIPAVKEHWATIRQFDNYRNSHELSKESKKYLENDGANCYIVDGQLKKAEFIPFRFEHNDKINRLNNKFSAQKPFIRIESLYSAKDYESDGVIVTDGFTLKNSEVKKFSFEPIDLSKRLGMGVWVKGDNGGGILKITIGMIKGNSLARGVYFINNDFTGWKYFAEVEHQQGDEKRLPIVEIDNTTYTTLQDFYGYYIGAIDMTRVEFVNAEYYGGGSVEIKPIKMVEHESRDIVNPTLYIGNQKITFNVTLKSTQTLELDFDGSVRVIDTKFNVLSNPSYIGEIPTVLNGENALRFECESNIQTRARIVVGVIGEDLN